MPVFLNQTDKTAFKRTDFSLFNRNKKFDSNPPVFDTKLNALTGGFKLDFRNYIEDGFFRRRVSLGNSFIIFKGNITYSNKKFLKSNLDFTKYEFTTTGRVNTFNTASLEFKVYGMYNNGTLPFQLLYGSPGNIDALYQSNSFRVLNVNEIFGDRVLNIFLEHNFGDELFRLLKIPGLKDWGILLSSFLDIAISEISERSKSILVHPIKTFNRPFYEAGFGIGHVLVPFKIEFAWRLNYLDKNNFRIGLSTYLF